MKRSAKTAEASSQRESKLGGVKSHFDWESTGVLPLLIAMLAGLVVGWFLFGRPFRKNTKFGGYVKKKPFLGRARYEHREIAEKIMGRRLEPGEVVHHINGRPWDNRPQNLCAMDRKDHDRYHEWYQYIYRTYGKYPRRETQLARLRDDFNGVLLKDILRRRKVG